MKKIEGTQKLGALLDFRVMVLAVAAALSFAVGASDARDGVAHRQQTTGRTVAARRVFSAAAAPMARSMPPAPGAMAARRPLIASAMAAALPMPASRARTAGSARLIVRAEPMDSLTRR